jgi:hypothetical protein
VQLVTPHSCRRTRWKTALITAALAAGPLALAAAVPALATVQPSVSYSETGNCPNGNGACTTHITIDSDPSNVEVRAWEVCSDGVTRLGSWHNGIGATSNTSSCSPAFVFRSGFDYRKSAPIRVTCFTEGNNRTGFC